jgi:hypothetical protein
LITGGVDGAFSIPGTTDLLDRGQLKMCKGDNRGPIHDTDDTVVVALWFLHTKLEDVQANSPTNITITDGYYRIDEQEAVSVNSPDKVYNFTKLTLRDEISSTLGVVLLESELNYTKLDLYVAFTNSLKHTRPVYVTRSLKCGTAEYTFMFDWMIIIPIVLILCPLMYLLCRLVNSRRKV